MTGLGKHQLQINVVRYYSLTCYVHAGSLSIHSRRVEQHSERAVKFDHTLLGLPSELLVQVLFRLDPTSFSVILLTCKTIRRHALHCKKLLLHQIDNILGSPYDLGTLSLDRLYQTFRSRASKHLYNGIQVFGDVIQYAPEHPTRRPPKSDNDMFVSDASPILCRGTLRWFGRPHS